MVCVIDVCYFTVKDENSPPLNQKVLTLREQCTACTSLKLSYANRKDLRKRSASKKDLRGDIKAAIGSILCWYTNYATKLALSVWCLIQKLPLILKLYQLK